MNLRTFFNEFIIRRTTEGKLRFETIRTSPYRFTNRSSTRRSY